MNALTTTLAEIAEAFRRQDPRGALEIAERALAESPDEPALLGLAAFALVQLERPDAAIAYLRRQLVQTPEDKACRFNLASLLVAEGQLQEARAMVADHAGHAKLTRLAALLHQETGDFAAAIDKYRAALALVPNDWGAWNNLGNCLSACGDLNGAIQAFENAINRHPGHGLPEIFLNLARALGTIENREARLRTAEEAARRFPDHHSVMIELGLARTGAGLNQPAIDILRKAAAGEAEFGEARLELGLLLEHLNRLDELDDLIEQGERLGRNSALDFVRAWALKRKGQFEAAKLLADQIPGEINPIRVAQLRGELADRLGDPPEAFRQFTIMNESSAAATIASAGPTYRQLIEAQTAAMAGPPGAAVPMDRLAPHFVVGFPRSGTTLLDTLLSNLPELQVFEERQMLAQVDAENAGLASSTDTGLIRAARERYFGLAEDFEGSLAGRRLVDKHPLHMAKLPLIDRLFPGARIVMVERHPADVILSCYMSNFMLNTAMRSFTALEEAARTYDTVFRNFQRACDLLPLTIHRVRYERLIADPQNEMRALLDFLGLEWREDVLDNQAATLRRGTVRTASYAQIGQPLYTRAVGRWERYREQLKPALPILQSWIEQMGYQG